MPSRYDDTNRDAAVTSLPAERWPAWPAEPAIPRGLRRPAIGGLPDTVADLLRRLGLIRLPRVARLAFPVAVAIASRLYSVLLLSLVSVIKPTLTLPRVSGYRDTFTQWDGQWYVIIAKTGYHAGVMQPGPFGGRHDFAFFPGWPMLLRAFDAMGIQPAVIAAPLADVLFVAAAVLMFLVLERALGTQAAGWGIVLLAFSPSSFVLSLAYSEPLFLILVSLALLRPTGPLRPVAAAAAMLTRVTGIGLAAAAGVAWLRNRRDWVALATVVSVTVAFAAWWVFIWQLTGNPLGWFDGSAHWSYHLGIPAMWDAVVHLASPGFLDVTFIGLMFGAAVLLVRRNLELGLYSLVAIGLSMLGAPVSSMPRHAIVAFPAFGLLADRLGPRRTLLLAIVFAVFEANSVWLSFIPWIPSAP